MAKSTKSQEIQTGTSDSYTADELQDAAAILRSRPVLGGELKSVGTSSVQSSRSDATSSDKPNPSLQAPAQTTENPSSQPETAANSGADLTDGLGPAEERSPSDEEIIKPASPSKARVTVASLDDDDFAALQ